MSKDQYCPTCRVVRNSVHIKSAYGDRIDVMVTASLANILRVILAACFMTAAHAETEPSEPSPPKEAPPPLSDTEGDDCEIFAVLGKELLGWGVTAPDISQFVIFYRPSGSSYAEQCPWAKLGIARLEASKPDLGRMRFFTQPSYSADKNTATVSFIVRLQGPGRSSPFVSEDRCFLERHNSHWKLKACKEWGIT
jgi:hypothetical protein